MSFHANITHFNLGSSSASTKWTVEACDAIWGKLRSRIWNSLPSNPLCFFIMRSQLLHWSLSIFRPIWMQQSWRNHTLHDGSGKVLPVPIISSYLDLTVSSSLIERKRQYLSGYVVHLAPSLVLLGYSPKNVDVDCLSISEGQNTIMKPVANIGDLTYLYVNSLQPM